MASWRGCRWASLNREDLRREFGAAGGMDRATRVGQVERRVVQLQDPEKSMIAIVQKGYGRPQDVLRRADIPTPEPGPGEVLVQMCATTVNTPDWIMVTGQPRVLRLVYGLREPSTPVRGSDVAGLVARLGPGVNQFAVGDSVVGATDPSGRPSRAGTFAEYALAPATKLVRKPEGLDWVSAASAVMSGVTAHALVHDFVRMETGTRVLVNGASGSVGTFAIQLAARRGAIVTGVTSSANAELVRSLGATEIIDYTQEDFTKSDRQWDVILDNVLNHPPRRPARRLARNGALIPNSVGNSGGWLAGLPRMLGAPLLKLRGVRVHMPNIDFDTSRLKTLCDLLADGRIRAVVDSVHELANAPAAVERMLSHRAVGNVAIRM